MLRIFAGISVTAFLSAAAFGQSTEAKPTYDIADVHVSAHSTNPDPYMTGGILRNGRYDIRHATMLDLIRTAWSVDADTVLGGPNWLESDRFDVVAKAPPATKPDTVNLMLQALIEDRFKLELHKDMKPLPAFALTVGKGKPKMKEAAGSGNAGCQFQPQNNAPGAIPFAVVFCRSMTMEGVAQFLRETATDYLRNPVIDSTGLKGAWDFDLKWYPRQLIPQAGADGITIFDAVDRQLGLKLELQKLAAPVIVVDKVNEKPTDNPPEVAKSLPPPPPAEFEVADLKPSSPDEKQFGRIQPGGRLDLKAFPLKLLIDIAWDIQNDEMLAGLPKSADTANFDLIAKTSTTTNGPANAPQIDIDDVRQMLRALLVDRFKMAIHTEDRPVTAYTLVSAKPKLTKADPSNRTSCKESPVVAKDPRDTTPSLGRLVTCQNITMAQFAEKLEGIAPGFIHNPVLDATGIDGYWDFTLSFSTAGFLQNAGGRGGDAGQAENAPAASEPTGGMSLFDAVSKQLGLKLEIQKRPMPVTVIDHMEEKPTDN